MHQFCVESKNQLSLPKEFHAAISKKMEVESERVRPAHKSSTVQRRSSPVLIRTLKTGTLSESELIIVREKWETWSNLQEIYRWEIRRHSISISQGYTSGIPCAGLMTPEKVSYEVERSETIYYNMYRCFSNSYESLKMI